MSSAPQARDPYAILHGWLAGAYVRPDGQEVIGRVWDEDTKYRYGLYLAGIDAPAGWKQDWFTYIDDLVWHFERLHVKDWAARLTAFDGSPLAAASRGRAVSAVRSFFAHCEDALGAARWNLPPRRALAGPTPPAERLDAERVRSSPERPARRARSSSAPRSSSIKFSGTSVTWMDPQRLSRSAGPSDLPPDRVEPPPAPGEPQTGAATKITSCP
ncbi:hypothetical protein [Streptomyces sp. NPDC002078]